MSETERDEVLAAFARLATGEAREHDPLATFLPLPAHGRALWSYYVVVLGSRGSGKTALFKLVNDPRIAPRLRGFFQSEHIPADALWLDAFSTSSRHPEVGTLEAYAAKAEDITLRAFWMTHLLRRVRDEVPEVVEVPAALEAVLGAPAADLDAWLPTATASLGAVNAALDAANRALVARDRFVVAAYDNLDLVGQLDPAIRRRYIRTLLALWLSLLSRYQRLRGKVFLRDDLFDAGELGFADATKLRGYAETLSWDHAALLRVAVRHLASGAEAVRAWLREVPGLELHDRGDLGWMPGEMKEAVQHAFIGRFAGKVIGRGVLKDYTSTWILGRLRDAQGRVTPRALLWFLGFAAEEARKRPTRKKGALVTPSDLLVALKRASRERVQELREEYPLVERVENLRGMTLWLDRDEVVKRLATPRSEEREGIPARGDVVLGELLRLGVLRARDDGTLDVPDIYRYSFEITPDYSTAWKDLLIGDEQSAREQFTRELPALDEILRRTVKTWNVADEDFARGDYQAARAKCERALEIARNDSNREGEAWLWAELCRISIGQGSFHQAFRELNRLAEIARRTGDSRLELVAEILRSVAHERSGSRDQAIGHWKRAVSLAQTHKRPNIEQFLLHTFSGWTWESGHPRIAHQLLSIAAALNGEAQAHVGGAQTYDDLLKLSRTIIAARLGLSADEIDALEREAGAAYARDRGWSLIRSVCPDNAEVPAG